MKKITIAIDGPAGAGKSTVARIVAERLNYTYIDTGAMYRAVAWKALQQKLSGNDAETIVRLSAEILIDLQYDNGKAYVKVDGIDVTDAIRTPEVTELVAAVAQIAGVRKNMVVLQRAMAETGGIVMDGRDVGSNILPNAELKIYLTASIEERAQRRWRELTQKGYAIPIDNLKEEISCRDKMDCERPVNPLVKAADAVFLDTTSLTINEAVEQILKFYSERVK